jgi:hypothetical protein
MKVDERMVIDDRTKLTPNGIRTVVLRLKIEDLNPTDQGEDIIKHC